MGEFLIAAFAGIPGALIGAVVGAFLTGRLTDAQGGVTTTDLSSTNVTGPVRGDVTIDARRITSTRVANTTINQRMDYTQRVTVSPQSDAWGGMEDNDKTAIISIGVFVAVTGGLAVFLQYEMYIVAVATFLYCFAASALAVSVFVKHPPTATFTQPAWWAAYSVLVFCVGTAAVVLLLHPITVPDALELGKRALRQHGWPWYYFTLEWKPQLMLLSQLLAIGALFTFSTMALITTLGFLAEALAHANVVGSGPAAYIGDWLHSWWTKPAEKFLIALIMGVLILALAAGLLTRIPKSTVEIQTVPTTSPSPNGTPVSARAAMSDTPYSFTHACVRCGGRGDPAAAPPAPA